MSSAPIHTQAQSFDEHMTNMRKMLAKGDMHFLIGGVVEEKGVRPVTFLYSIDGPETEYLLDITSPVVEQILREIGGDLYASLMRNNAH